MSRYNEVFKVRTNDLDTYDHVKPYVYLDFFQDVAGHHADILGVGYEACKSVNVAWVLMKNKLEIFKSPLPYEEVEVITWPSSRSRIDFGRDYQLKNKAGEVLVQGTSQWVYADINTHRILRSTALEFPLDADEEPIYQDKIEKIDIEEVKCKEVIHSHLITNSDLDHYGHTNNARYAVMIFDALENKKDKLVKSLIINYLAEAHLGETVEVYLDKNGDNVIGYGRVKEDGRISFSFKLGY